jgi:GAF domain-containing protein
MPENTAPSFLDTPLKPIETGEILNQWREKLLNYILRTSAVIGLLALIASMISDIRTHNWTDLAITSGVYAMLLAIILIRLPYRVRAVVTIVLLYALMMNSLLASGIRGDALPYGIGFCVFSLMLLGVWAGGIALGVSFLSIAVVGWATVTERITLSYLYDQLDPSVWFSGNLSMPLIAVLVMLGVILLQREFITAQTRERLAMDVIIRDREDLEARVAERTRELALAADVGRSVSQLRDMNTLLSNAVELIRKQFNLYYAQIYLVDATGRTLTLRAGTGGVGAELMRRGHRLALGSGSINGVAAAERRPMIVADTAVDPIFRPNPLLPETRSELSMPLMVGERVVGVLDLQSRHPGALSSENLSVYEALAGQLAIALDNAALFAQTERARHEVEEQSRRLTQSGWQEFLNALERSERIGYVYDENTLMPFNEPFPQTQSENTVKSSIIITGAPVGTIQLERPGDEPWQPEEVRLVTAVSEQASRQLDNLRLLAQAESYRIDAEEAARRLTREGWAEFLQTRTEINGFVYNRTEVQPLTEGALSGEAPVNTENGLPEAGSVHTVVQPLQVGAEVVGELAFEGVDALDPGTNTLVSNVAGLLSSHIEELRLTEQTQKALIETEDLYSASAELNTARTYAEILDILRRHTLAGQGAHVALLNLFNRPGSANDIPEWMDAVATWSDPDLSQPLSLETMAGRSPLAFYPSSLATLNPDFPTLIEDVVHDTRLDEAGRDLYMGQLKAGSILILPLVAGGQWIGYVCAGYKKAREFPSEEVRRTIALAGQAAVAVNNLRLLGETQALAQREKNLRQITALVRGSTNADAILRTATRELGVVLGRKVKVQLNTGEKE